MARPQKPRRLLPRQLACVTLHATAAVALVPGFLFLAPASRWEDPVVLALLAVLAVIASRSEVPLPGGTTFDGAIALMLFGVASVGPLAAMVVVVAPMLVNAVTRRRGLWRAATPGELASHGWQAISAALLLKLGGVTDPASPQALGWLILAGLTLYTVGWALAPAIYGPLWLGRPFRTLAIALVDMLPAGAVMIVLGAATVVLSGPLGVLALAIFALIAILPMSFLTYAARTRPVARLDQATATRRYAHAVAVQLGYSMAQRRHLARVVAAAQERPATGDALDYVCALLEDPAPANYDAQVMTEWWNGRGAPVGLNGHKIPEPARVLAVAHTWAALTAHDTPELSHRDALDHLQAVAGIRLDPAIVQAARAVTAQELVTIDAPAPEPRLHHLRIPAPLRRALSGTAVGRVPEGLP